MTSKKPASKPRQLGNTNALQNSTAPTVASELARVGPRSGPSAGSGYFQVNRHCLFGGCCATQRRASLLTTEACSPHEPAHPKKYPLTLNELLTQTHRMSPPPQSPLRKLNNHATKQINPRHHTLHLGILLRGMNIPPDNPEPIQRRCSYPS